MRNEGVDSVRVAVNAVGNDRYVQKCKPGISDSTLMNTITFQRAFEVGFSVCRGITFNVGRLLDFFVVFYPLNYEVIYQKSQKRLYLIKASGC